MSDLGAPTSYLALQPGTAVITSDGQRLGTVQHVLAAVEEDVFDGLVIDTPDGSRFADAELVDRLYDHAAVLTLSAEAARRLPAPSANPAEVSAGPDDVAADGSGLNAKLRRAWDLISGNY
jgi:hypothetical protein